MLEAQEHLLEESGHCEPRKLERRLAHWRHRGDAAAEVERANKQHTRRQLKIAPKAGGMFGVSGDLDAEGGAMVLTALDALSAPDPNIFALPFLTGVDHFVPAQVPTRGTVTILVTPRGQTRATRLIRFPRTASTVSAISVVLRDFEGSAPTRRGVSQR